MSTALPADEDAVLMRETFQLQEPYSVLSPVHIPRGFTKAYIAGEVVEDLGAKIRRAHATFADHDVLLVEGTGHAGVGAVIGLSNAVVAASLGTPAIIVSEGGVGRPIDEIVLNASLFTKEGVPVAGAIVNKVDLVSQPGIAKVLERGLAPYGIPLLGVLPVSSILSNPTLEMILEGLNGETIHAGPDLDRVIDGVAIGAMEPGHMLERVGPKTLVIVPGDREDVILTLTTAHLMGTPRSASVEELTQPTLRLEEAHAGRGDRAGADRRLPAAAGSHLGDPSRGSLRDPRSARHLLGRLRGARPPRQDPRRRSREDRADQGAGRLEPRHRPHPVGGIGAASLGRRPSRRLTPGSRRNSIRLGAGADICRTAVIAVGGHTMGRHRLLLGLALVAAGCQPGAIATTAAPTTAPSSPLPAATAGASAAATPAATLPIALERPTNLPTDGSCEDENSSCLGVLEAGKVYTSKVFEPAVTFTMPTAGWINQFDGGGDIGLESLDPAGDAIIFFRDPRAIDKSVGEGIQDIAQWLETNDNLRVTPFEPVKLGGLSGLVMDVATADGRDRHGRRVPGPGVHRVPARR